MKTLNKQSFIQKLSSLKTVDSVTGKRYKILNATNDKVIFLREGKTKSESINTSELFDFYSKGEFHTTTEAKNYISGRVQSPAVAIINAIKNKSSQNEKLFVAKAEKPAAPIPVKVKEAKSTLKDEARFFKAFATLVGSDYFKSKSIGRLITSGDVFLSNDYRKYGFKSEINLSFKILLERLNSDFSFGGTSLSHHIDGFLINHPVLGSRIVEFDEEQHFTPALRDALIIQSENIENKFNQYYLDILDDLEYLKMVLKKHRVNYSFDKYPAAFSELVEVLKNQKVSGYIKPKNGFPYIGGRIAQRAYYDCLRNAAHLSEANSGFRPILRFPKKYFEDETKLNFGKISEKRLIELIHKYLNEVYLIMVAKSLRKLKN